MTDMVKVTLLHNRFWRPLQAEHFSFWDIKAYIPVEDVLNNKNRSTNGMECFLRYYNTTKAVHLH